MKTLFISPAVSLLVVLLLIHSSEGSPVSPQSTDSKIVKVKTPTSQPKSEYTLQGVFVNKITIQFEEMVVDVTFHTATNRNIKKSFSFQFFSPSSEIDDVCNPLSGQCMEENFRMRQSHQKDFIEQMHLLFLASIVHKYPLDITVKNNTIIKASMTRVQ